jgi:hypothetical protein
VSVAKGSLFGQSQLNYESRKSLLEESYIGFTASPSVDRTGGRSDSDPETNHE